MSRQDTEFEQRRKVVTFLGAGAVALPVLGLAGCGGDKSDQASGSMSEAADTMQDAAQDTMSAAESSAEAAMDEMESTAESAMDEVESATESAQDTMKETMESAEAEASEAMADAETIATDAADTAGGAIAKVDENGPQAAAVAYRHDATTVDSAAQPRYAKGQQCSNCALFQGGDAGWGGCPIFAGKQVKATGWCNAYASAG